MDPISWIANLRGPEFLVLYSTFCVVVLIAAVVWSKRLDPAPMSGAIPPQPTATSDPYEIAWLREGLSGVLTTALFSLRQRGLVSLGQRRANRIAEPAQPLDRVERPIFDAIGTSRAVAELKTDGRLAAALAPAIAGYESRLLHAGLLTSPNERGRAWTAMFAGILAVLGLGGFKLVAALSTGHTNVGFLILIAIAISVAIAVACWPRRLNKRGREYVQSLSTTYAAFGTRAGNAPAVDTMLPLYVAVLGTGVLAGTQYDDFHKEYQRTAGSSGGTSCGGGSCSGGGSSDGGGGGSSCGGGGCGGCGGGGCGG